MKGFFHEWLDTSADGGQYKTSWGEKLMLELAVLGYYACDIRTRMGDWLDVERGRF